MKLNVKEYGMHTYSLISHTCCIYTDIHNLSSCPPHCSLLAHSSDGALSVIAFTDPLIILMVLYATQWASVCLCPIKITQRLSGQKWKLSILLVCIFLSVYLT